MTEKITYVILDAREPLLKSITRYLALYGFLILCAYVSRGSAWWTFVSGGLFLFALYHSMNNLLTNASSPKFKDKQPMIDWINKLPD